MRELDGMHVLQEWEGYVLNIEGDVFVAQLVDVTAGKAYADEEAIIPLDQVSEHDAANMEIGSIFRWVIGYEGSPRQTRKSMSQIVFLDLGKMTEDDLRAGREWADKIARALNP